MKVLITGGCGFIGYNLCINLLSDVWNDWELLVIDDLSTGHKTNKLDDIEYIHKALQSPGLLADVFKGFKPEVVFHFAAVPRVSYSVEHPLETARANVGGTLHILEAVRRYGSRCRIINSSSSSVYGGANVLPTPESHGCFPVSPYALQKHHAEGWCEMYANLYGLDVASLRYFNVFGPHSRYGGAYSTVLSAWLYSLYGETEIKPYLEGDGTQSRDFCFVDNVVNANIKVALSSDGFHGECFNIAQGSAHSLLECKGILEKISGKPLDLEMRPDRVGDVKHTLADISKACDRLGYKPTTDFEDQIRSMALWYEKDYHD